MKILIVSQYFYPENFQVNDLASKLQSREHQITVLTGMPNYPEGKIFQGFSKFIPQTSYWKGVEVIRVPLIPRQKGLSWHLALNYLSFLISACVLAPILLRRRKFDVVFSVSYSPATSNIPAILMKRIKKIPMLIWVQDLWPESLSATGSVKSETILSNVRYMMRWIYNQSDVILVQSPAFKGPIQKLSDVENKITLFPNWAEDIFRPQKKSSNSSLPDGFKVMFAGNLGKAQSLEVIIGAAELLRDQPINWIILGGGRQADWFRTEVRAKKLSHCVHQLGRLNIEEMPDYFSQADAMLITLGSDPIVAKTIPGKTQSYLASGRPVIGALDGEGARVLRESGAGLVVPSGDIDGLAKAVQLMASYSDNDREKLGAKAFAYYEQNFNCIKLIGKLENEMTKLVQSNK